MLGQVDTSRAVVAQYVAEEFWVSVKEILVGVGVVEKFFLDGAQKRVGVLLDSLLPRLKASSTNVETQSSVSEAPRSAVMYSWWHRPSSDWYPADR